jgi:hypothetical protein
MVELHLLEGAMQGVDEAELNQPAYLVDCSQMEVARQVD